MFCPNCGEKNAPEDKYCIYCGAELIDNQDFPDESTDFTADTKRILQLVWSKIKCVGKSMQRFLKRHPKVCIPLAAIAGCFVILSVVNATVFSGKQAVRKYFMAIMNDNSRAVYSCLDLPESDFVNASKFDDYFQTLGYKEAKVGNYQIDELGSTSSKDDESITSDYQVTYYLRGDSSTRSMYVELVRIPQFFGLINHYKVLSNYVVTGYTILAPEGSTVTVEGIELKNPVVNGNSESYTIPSMFNTDYEITITNQFGAETGTFVPGRRGTDADIYNSEVMSYNAETISAMYSQAQAQFSELLNSATAQQSFPADIAQTTDSDLQNDIARRFSDLKSNFYDSNSGTGLTGIQITGATDNSYSGQTFSANSPMEYTCEFDFNFNYTRRVRNWDGTIETVNGSSSGRATMYYIYENEAWALEGFNYYL